MGIGCIKNIRFSSKIYTRHTGTYEEIYMDMIEKGEKDIRGGDIRGGYGNKRRTK